jgi:hypothetical protein
MGRARDIIQEIADVRQRRRFGSAMTIRNLSIRSSGPPSAAAELKR